MALNFSLKEGKESKVHILPFFQQALNVARQIFSFARRDSGRSQVTVLGKHCLTEF